MESQSLLQAFAMDKEGRIRSVDEVARGLGCECICPACGAAVIARQGDIREWHFAHVSDNHHDGCTESALHQAAKQLLLEGGGLTVPEIRVKTRFQLPDGRAGSGEAYRPECWLDFQSVDAEKTVGSIRPDIVAVVGGTMLFVEIAVTHFVDAEKNAVLADLGIPTVEINLASYQCEKWTWELLGEAVLEHARVKRWVHLLEHEHLHHEAQEAAMRAALLQPVPALESSKPVSSSSAVRTRFWISGRMVDAIERPFGIAVWSPYDPELNVLIKSIVRRLGGRWQPRFKNWLLPLASKPWLFDELSKHSSRAPEPWVGT